MANLVRKDSTPLNPFSEIGLEYHYNKIWRRTGTMNELKSVKKIPLLVSNPILQPHTSTFCRRLKEFCQQWISLYSQPLSPPEGMDWHSLHRWGSRDTRLLKGDCGYGVFPVDGLISTAVGVSHAFDLPAPGRAQHLATLPVRRRAAIFGGSVTRSEKFM
jgi:hypothetical protein